MPEAASWQRKYRMSIHWHTSSLPRLSVEGPWRDLERAAILPWDEKHLVFPFPKKFLY